MKNLLARFWFVLLAALAAATPARAVDISHYSLSPGIAFLDDYFLPPEAAGKVIYAQYSAYYGTETFRNSDGQKVDKITVTGPAGVPRTVDIDLDVDTWIFAPVLIFSPGWKILGARYGSFVMLPLGNPSVAANLQSSTGSGPGRSVQESSFAQGDLYVQPIWLEWNFGKVDVTGAYGFYAPTGKYSPGAADNVGLGFWGHQLQSGLRYRVSDQTAAYVVLTGEINHNKEDEDITPGSHLSMNWGFRRYFFGDWFQAGLCGYSTWQTSDDTGDDVTKDPRDQVHAAGLQIGIPKYGLGVKYMHEFAAQDRFDGQVVSIFFALPLDLIAQHLLGSH